MSSSLQWDEKSYLRFKQIPQSNLQLEREPLEFPDFYIHFLCFPGMVNFPTFCCDSNPRMRVIRAIQTLFVGVIQKLFKLTIILTMFGECLGRKHDLGHVIQKVIQSAIQSRLNRVLLGSPS